MRGRMESRLDALERGNGCRDPWPKGVFFVDEGEALPDGVDESDPEVLVVRFVGVEPIYDVDGSVIPRPVR